MNNVETNPAHNNAAQSNKHFEVLVNGRPKPVIEDQLSYWQVVTLAFPDATASQTAIFTVLYKHGPASNREGSLVEGHAVQIKSGMVFNVTRTDRS